MAISLGQFLEQPADKTPYFCYPLLPRRGRMIIGAPPKSFKSFLALGVAYDFAEGAPIFGLFNVKEPFTTLIVEQEIGPHRLKERLTCLHNYRCGKIAPMNLYIASKDLNINLHTPLGLKMLSDHIEQSMPSILILDPLRKLHRRDEDESTQMVEIFHNLDKLQAQYELSTIIVHHTGKRSEFRRMSDPEALRGSSEIYADVDTAVMVEQPVPNDKTVLRLHFTLRSSAEPPPLMLRFDPNAGVFRQAEK